MGKTNSKVEPDTTTLPSLNSSGDSIQKLAKKHSRKKVDKSKPDDYVFFVVTIGESGVGKTSIITSFSDSVPPTEGVNFEAQSVMVDTTKIGLEIWDISGEERTRVPTSYYQDCKAVIAVYDISNRESFVKLEKWIDDCNRLAGKDLADNAKWLVGNKLDQERAVTVQEAQEFAKKMNMSHFEVSAKTGSHIEDLFMIIGCAIKP